jgi:anaerobic magnesium-protoporphyrin IX monomethyl ester cyclase
MRIVLINPPFLFPTLEEAGLSHCLGLRSLVSYLKSHGHKQVKFIDAFLQGFDYSRPFANGYRIGLTPEEIAERIPANTELIGLSAPFSHLVPVIHDIAEKIKIRHPHVTLVMGGVYPSVQPELSLTSAVDYIVIGEGEIAFEKLASGITASSIPGVYKTVPVSGFKSAPYVEELDQIPIPDLDITFIDRYFTLSPHAARGQVASIMTSRGCPFGCAYCAVPPLFGCTFRAHSAQYVLEHIRVLQKRFDIQYVEFEDDNFTFQYERVMEILQGIIRLNQQNEPIHWRTPNDIFIDTLDEELIRVMKTSNCQSVTLALEHGDADMLEIMNKKLDPAKAFEVIQLLVKYRIPQIDIQVTVGYPGETRKRFQNSLKFLKEIRRLGGNIHVRVKIAQPYPGTPLADRCLKDGIIQNINFGNFLSRIDFLTTSRTVSITTADFNAAEVLKRADEIQRIFKTVKFLPLFVQSSLPQLIIDQFKKAGDFILGKVTRP